MTVKSLTLAWPGLKQHVVMRALPLPVARRLTPARPPAPPPAPSLLPTPPVPPARLLEAHIYRLLVLRSQDVKATCLFPAQHYLFPSLGICSHGNSAKTPSLPSPVYILPFLKTRLLLTLHSLPYKPFFENSRPCPLSPNLQNLLGAETYTSKSKSHAWCLTVA